MSNYVSPKLQKPLRTEAEATEARVRRRNLARLNEIATRLRMQAELQRQQGGMRHGPNGRLVSVEYLAGELDDDAYAVRWAIERIEGPAQVLGEIARAGE